MKQPITIDFAGQTVYEATIVEWKKQVGDRVEEGEIIVEVNTEKVEVEISAPCSGILVEICAHEDDEVKVAREDQNPDIIGYVETEGEAQEAGRPGPSEVSTEPEELDESSEDEPTKPQEIEAPVRSGEKIRATPLVRKMAQERGINLAEITGTGPGNRITRSDLEKFLRFCGGSLEQVDTDAKPKEIPTAEEVEHGTEILEMSRIETVRAKRMDVSATIPRACTFLEVDFTQCFLHRPQISQRLFPDGAISISPFHFVIGAGLHVLSNEKYTLLNSSFRGYNDKGRGSWQKNNIIHLGFSVDPANDLRILVVRDVSRKNFSVIVQEMRRLTDLFLEGTKLSIHEMRGATIVFNNPGVFGSEGGFQLISVEEEGPHAAIIGLHAIRKKPIVVGEDATAIRPIGFLDISWDHRLFGGRLAIEFLHDVKRLLENEDFYLNLV